MSIVIRPSAERDRAAIWALYQHAMKSHILNRPEFYITANLAK